MALYKHVAGREALIDAMVEHVVGGITAPPPSSGWQHAVRDRVLAARAALARHAWARAAIESRTLAGPFVLAHMDALMTAMFAGGLSPDLVHHGMHALSTRMWGFTRDVMPTPPVPADADARTAALAGFAASYPAIVRMATTASHAGTDCDENAEFAFALDLLLDGIAQRHEAGWTAPGSAGGHVNLRP